MGFLHPRLERARYFFRPCQQGVQAGPVKYFSPEDHHADLLRVAGILHGFYDLQRKFKFFFQGNIDLRRKTLEPKVLTGIPGAADEAADVLSPWIMQEAGVVQVGDRMIDGQGGADPAVILFYLQQNRSKPRRIEGAEKKISPIGLVILHQAVLYRTLLYPHQIVRTVGGGLQKSIEMFLALLPGSGRLGHADNIGDMTRERDAGLFGFPGDGKIGVTRQTGIDLDEVGMKDVFQGVHCPSILPRAIFFFQPPATWISSNIPRIPVTPLAMRAGKKSSSFQICVCMSHNPGMR